jgi:hypothetical protein
MQSTITAGQKKTQSGPQARSNTALVVGPFPVALAKQGSATVRGWATASDYYLGIQGQGAAQRLLQLAEISGLQAPHLTADGNVKFNLAVAGGWHGFAAPRPTGTALLKSVKAQLPGVDGALEIRSANVTLDPDNVQVSGLVASAGGSNWEGSLSFPRPCHLLGGCPIHFDLRSDAVAAESLHQWFSGGGNRAWYQFSGFGSDSPTLLSLLNANGTLAANRLVIHGVTATRVSGKLDVQDGVLHFSDVVGDVLGGQHGGEWTVNLAVSPPEFSGTGKFEHVDLVELAAAMHDGWIAGTANASYEFSASGKTAQDWLASSKGTLLFDMRDGSLPHLVIASGGGALKVRRFTGRMALDDGTFELAKGKLESASGSYQVTGTASPGQKLQMKLVHSGGGYAIDGTLSAPHVVPINIPDTRASLKP